MHTLFFPSKKKHRRHLEAFILHADSSESLLAKWQRHLARQRADENTRAGGVHPGGRPPATHQAAATCVRDLTLSSFSSSFFFA